MILAISADWFPQTWAGIVGIVTTLGIIIGSVIAFFALRAERKKTGQAHAETNRVYEQTITAQKEFIKTLKDSHEAALDLMTSERDDYRKKSHDLSGELQACSLKIKEFELRPDLTTLYHAQQTWHEQREKFYKNMFESQDEMLKAQREMFNSQQKMLSILESLAAAILEKNGNGKKA